MTDALEGLAARIDRLEASDAIRQLAFKYALAIDMRDLDSIVNLYVENVRVTRTDTGRQALKAVFAGILREFTSSVHHVGPHIIEFDDADNAHGVVYCRCEHEIGTQWLPMYLYYLDVYKRVDGIWQIKRRINAQLYGVVTTEIPAGPDKVRWPGRKKQDGTWHAHFPSWKEFWDKPEADILPVGPAAPPNKFIDQMRRGERRAIVTELLPAVIS